MEYKDAVMWAHLKDEWIEKQHFDLSCFSFDLGEP